MAAQRVTACRVAVPTVLHVHAASLDEPAPPPDVRVAFRAAGETEAEDRYTLTLIEAGEVANWLMAAAHELEDVHADDGDPTVAQNTYESIEELDRGRLTLHGSRLGQTGDCDDVGVMVDTAAGAVGSVPRVRLAFIDDIVVYSLPATRALETAAALVSARAYLRDNPLVVVRDLVVGALQGAVSSGEACAVEVELEGQINEPAWPRVTLHIGSDSSLPATCGGSWYLLDDEATRIAELLQTAAASAAGRQHGPIGALTNDRLPADPWLAVAVAAPPFLASPGESCVMVRFDDQLVRESGGDGCLWLPPEKAQILAQSLARAVEQAEAHPPLVFRPTGDHVIADLRWH